MSEEKKRGRAPNPNAQNGVAPPGKGTTGALVWAVCDKLNAKDNAKPTAVIEEVLKKGPELNPSTIKAQLARWRQFHGMVTPRT